MKAGKRLIIYLVILCCVLVALVSVIYFSKVNKYKMSDIEVEQYQQCVNDYENINSNIVNMGGTFSKQYDEVIDKNDFLYNHICNLKSEYMNMIEIEFPNKYTELYKQLIYANCVLDMSNALAFATFDPILDKDVGKYFPPNEIGRYTHRLEEQLLNPNYVPSDVSRPDFEQIYFRIEQEYIEGNKSASEIYDELNEIFHNEDFLQKLN